MPKKHKPESFFISLTSPFYWERLHLAALHTTTGNHRVNVSSTTDALPSHNGVPTKAGNCIGAGRACETEVLQTPFAEWMQVTEGAWAEPRIPHYPRSRGRVCCSDPRGRPGSLITLNWTTAALQTECYLVPVWGGRPTLMRWPSAWYVSNGAKTNGSSNDTANRSDLHSRL